MRFKTRIKLIRLAFSRKFDHVAWFTFQLKTKRADGRFETFVESNQDGRIQNVAEIIKGHLAKHGK